MRDSDAGLRALLRQHHHGVAGRLLHGGLRLWLRLRLRLRLLGRGRVGLKQIYEIITIFKHALTNLTVIPACRKITKKVNAQAQLFKSDEKFNISVRFWRIMLVVEQ